MISKLGLSHIKSQAIKVGDCFGRLTVLAVGQVKETRRTFAVCQCSCGSSPKQIRFDSLLKGVTQSCGCFHKEQTSTHRMTKNHHYKRWWHMVDRCTNPNAPAYADYGGRGIKVCDRWMDVANFIADLPEGYFPGAEIDRYPDNDGNYEPGNVRWATSAENADNRRSRHLIELNGKTQSLTAWARDVGISESTMRDRLFVSKWPKEIALTEPAMSAKDVRTLGLSIRWAGHVTPPKKSPRVLKRFEYKGNSMSIRDISELTGISVALLRKRLCERGWPIEKAVIP